MIRGARHERDRDGDPEASSTRGPARDELEAPPDKRVRAVTLAREALEVMGATVCPTAISASISYPYAYAEGLTPQEREPDGRARAELAEVWAWLQRDGIVATTPYDATATRPTGHIAARPGGIVVAAPDDHAAGTPTGTKAKRSAGKTAKGRAA